MMRVPDGTLEIKEAFERLAATVSEDELAARVAKSDGMLRIEDDDDGDPETIEAWRKAAMQAMLAHPWAMARPDDPAWAARAKREFAVEVLHGALCAGTIDAKVEDGESHRYFRVTPDAWRGAAFWRETIFSGCIRASACEKWEAFDGKTVLIEREQFESWLKDRSAALATAPDGGTETPESAARAWLQRAIGESPEQPPRPKDAMRREAMNELGISGRLFDRVWALEVPTAWRRPGRPKSSH